MARRRKTPRQRAKDRATQLHSLIVRSRGVCESCGETEYRKLQCAHVISRRYAHTRTDEANALCLDASCHIYFTINPVEFAKFVEAKIGRAEYERLWAKAQQRTKVDWQAEVERLEGVWARIEQSRAS